MYSYTMSQGNPEGTDYCIVLEHNTPYSESEFQDICEASIMEALNKMIERGDGYVSLFSIDSRVVLEVMESKGFKILLSCDYYLEPYWNRNAIKNPELLEWAKGKKHDPDGDK